MKWNLFYSMMAIIVLVILGSLFINAQVSMAMVLFVSSMFGFWILVRVMFGHRAKGGQPPFSDDLELLDTLAQTIHSLLEDELGLKVFGPSKGRGKPMSQVRLRAEFHELEAAVREQHLVVERMAKSVNRRPRRSDGWRAFFKAPASYDPPRYLELFERELALKGGIGDDITTMHGLIKQALALHQDGARLFESSQQLFERLALEHDDDALELIRAEAIGLSRAFCAIKQRSEAIETRLLAELVNVEV
jgi:hypothetical protein